MATQEEVEEAVRWVRGQGNNDIVLLHCTSAYPTPLAATNLRRMRTLSDIFECLVGFSDHTEGITAATAAVALGAVWIEKHFTTDRSLPGPDQCFSSNPAEFAALVSAVRSTGVALGLSEIAPADVEQASRREYRLSRVAACNIEAGSILSDADIDIARPGTGLPPKACSLLPGQRLLLSIRSQPGLPSNNPESSMQTRLPC
jgi:N,N'-diacetyllegionaminate synthase